MANLLKNVLDLNGEYKKFAGRNYSLKLAILKWRRSGRNSDIKYSLDFNMLNNLTSTTPKFSKKYIESLIQLSDLSGLTKINHFNISDELFDINKNNEALELARKVILETDKIMSRFESTSKIAMSKSSLAEVVGV